MRPFEQDIEMIHRLVELYREGGLPEVSRGIRDWYLYTIKRPVVTRIRSRSEIEVGDVSIQWAIDNQESTSRAIGISETAVMEDFVASIEPGEVFWDIGANQGVYSMLAAVSGLDVHAFEPGDDARAVLAKNARLNDVDITTYPIALDKENGEKILAETGTTGSRNIVSDGEGDLVSVKRGDEVSAPAPDVMKIDVEGFELRVLQGLGDVMQHCRLCYVEVHDDDDLHEVEEVLAEQGLDQTTRLPDVKTIIRASE